MTGKIFFEDLHAGQVFVLGETTVAKGEMIEFAAEFDPQPFHLDETAGRASILGGLAASGWHTASMVMRLFVDGFLSNASCQGSPGIDKLSWLKPVYPGDVLRAEAHILAVRELKSRPNLGLATAEIRAFNQTNTPVLTFINPILFAKREVNT